MASVLSFKTSECCNGLMGATNLPLEQNLACTVSQVCIHPNSSCQSTDLFLREGTLGNVALLVAQDGKNSKMTFGISAGNILLSDLNKAMTVPLIFLG